MKILVVEDDETTGSYIARGLREEGQSVDLVTSGRVALIQATSGQYDVLIVDRMVPEIDGMTLVRTLRGAGNQTPVLFLTSLGSVEDRIMGLTAGADDYLVKPFAFGELSARVRSLLRREAARGSAVLRVGELELDESRHRARRNDRELDLTAKEFSLLRYFMSRPEQVLSQEHLLEHVWDEHADPFTNTVRVTVGTLRRKLSQGDEPTLIETVIGSGYRLLERPPGSTGDES